MKVEKLKTGEFRVSIKYSRNMEPAVGVGNTEKDAWKNLAKDLAYEYLQLEKGFNSIDIAIGRIQAIVDRVK